MWVNQHTMFRGEDERIRRHKKEYLEGLVSNYDTVHVADEHHVGEFLIAFESEPPRSRDLITFNKDSLTLRCVGWEDTDERYDYELSDVLCHLLVDVDYEKMPPEYK